MVKVIILCCTVLLHLASALENNSASNSNASAPLSQEPNPTTAANTTENVDEFRHRDLNYDSDYCTCDLTNNKCDWNCCCDRECSRKVIDQIFSGCIGTRSKLSDSNYCYSTSGLWAINNNNYKTLSSSLFCVVKENVMKRDAYTNRPFIKNLNEKRLSPKHVFGWGDRSNLANSISTNQLRLRYGSPIKILSEGPKNTIIHDTFKLPRNLLDIGTGRCDSLRPIGYLVNSKHSCLQRVDNLISFCETNNYIRKATFYNFILDKRASSNINENIVTRWPLITSTTKSKRDTTNRKLFEPKCLSLDECTRVFASKKTESMDGPKLIKANNGKLVCANVVSSVHYSIGYDLNDGITNVMMSLEFDNITEKDAVINQTFEVSFYDSNTTIVNRNESIVEILAILDNEVDQLVDKSGNPGYLFGKPVIAAYFNTSATTKEERNLTGTRYEELALFSQKSPIGRCTQDSEQKRHTITFGKNMYTGCLLDINTSIPFQNFSCQALQTEINKYLDVDNQINYVGAFGNTDLANFSDWVEILVDQQQYMKTMDTFLTYNSKCHSITTGFSYSIYYAYVGTKQEPQAKIIGAIKRFHKPIEVAINCIDEYCSQFNSPTLVAISTSVSFYDITKPTRPHYAPPPSIKFQFPADFFYPFLLNNSPSLLNTSQMYVITLTMMIITNYVIDY